MKRLLLSIKFLLAINLIALALGVSLSNAQQSTRAICYTSNGINCISAIASYTTIPIAISSATTTKIIAAVSGQSIYVTSWDGISSATGTFKWIYGTSVTTPCDTGSHDLTGAYAFGASSVFSKGNGLGSIITVPSGNDLCAVSTSTINIQGSVSYVQF